MLEREITVLAEAAAERTTVQVVEPPELMLEGEQERELSVAGGAFRLIVAVRETPAKVAVIVTTALAVIEPAVAVKEAVD